MPHPHNPVTRLKICLIIIKNVNINMITRVRNINVSKTYTDSQYRCWESTFLRLTSLKEAEQKAMAPSQSLNCIVRFMGMWFARCIAMARFRCGFFKMP